MSMSKCSLIARDNLIPQLPHSYWHHTAHFTALPTPHGDEMAFHTILPVPHGDHMTQHYQLREVVMQPLH
jgi:hypothetical protein